MSGAMTKPIAGLVAAAVVGRAISATVPLGRVIRMG